MRDTRKAFRARAKQAEQWVDEAIALERAERAQKHAEIKERVKAEEAARHRFTRDEIVGAAGVRDDVGWHPVLKVNAKTVTVATPYSWVDRIPFDRIREVRHNYDWVLE